MDPPRPSLALHDSLEAPHPTLYLLYAGLEQGNCVKATAVAKYHTGGFKAAHEAAPQARLFLRRAALSRKFVRNPDGTGRPIELDAASAEAIRKAATGVV